MGQYYMAHVINDNGYTKVYNPNSIGYGLKLTENANMPSKLVNSVLRDILNEPKRIAWVGDYASDVDDEEKLAKLAKYITPNADCVPNPHPLNFDKLEDYAGWFLLNHDKKECVSLSKYINKNTRIMVGEYELADGQRKRDLDMFCMSPLALLTACGNGMGSGDYRGTDEAEVGRWAFDLIEFRKGSETYSFNPTYHGFKLINPRFVDSWVDAEWGE